MSVPKPIYKFSVISVKMPGDFWFFFFFLSETKPILETFPGDPVAKSQVFHCRVLDSVPDWGSSTCHMAWPKKEKEKNLS